MPDLLQPPARPIPKQLAPFAWDSATARLMKAKSDEAKRQRKAALNPPAPSPSDDRLALVIEQIALTRKALNNSCEPKDRAQLVRALCGLLDRERILRGEPLPGSRKPPPERRQQDTSPGAWLAQESPPTVAPVLHDSANSSICSTNPKSAMAYLTVAGEVEAGEGI